eukprot:gene5187-6312_t
MGKAKRKNKQAVATEVSGDPSGNTSDRPAKRTKAADGEAKSAEAGPSDRGTSIVEKTTFRNKEKVLILATRGITHRYRHLMGDLKQILPHHKSEPKLDTKDDRGVVNEVAELQNCTSAVLFEVRKHTDLYMWLAKTPAGPSVKFHVVNIHTMAELKLSGNHLLGSRPVLSFDATFDKQPHLQTHRKVKPFFDHVFSFSVADTRIWFRNYQVVLPSDKAGKQQLDGMTLVEVGPRMCLNPIRIFAGGFGGAVLYDNPHYVSPNQ